MANSRLKGTELLRLPSSAPNALVIWTVGIDLRAPKQKCLDSDSTLAGMLAQQESSECHAPELGPQGNWRTIESPSCGQSVKAVHFHRNPLQPLVFDALEELEAGFSLQAIAQGLCISYFSIQRRR